MTLRAGAGRVALAIVAPLAILELVLQAGALVASLRGREEAPRDAGCAVLCVGDSFTWGFGASDASSSYPARLGQRLRDAPLAGEAEVVNGAWPGRDSRGLVQELPRQVEESRPRVVAMLIGVNDLWSQPLPQRIDELAGSGAGYRLEWRTPRLARLLWFSLRGAKEGGDRDDPSRVVAVDEDPARPEPKPPRASGQGRRVGRPELMQAARRALAEGAPDEMLAASARWVEAEPEEPRAHELRVEAAVRARRPDLAEAELDWLKRWHAGHAGDLVAAESLVRALTAANRIAEIGAVARQAVIRHEGSALLWTAIATSAMNSGANDEAERAVSRALEISDDARDGWRFKMRATLRMRRGAFAEAASDLLQAHALEPDPEALRQILRPHRDSFRPAMFEEAGRELGLPVESVAAVVALVAAETDPGNRGGSDVLRGHLEEVVRFCRERGIVPLILGYPFRVDPIDAIQREAARSLGVAFVDLAARFEGLLADRPRSDYFVADGHCNDAGYAEIARAVDEELRRLPIPPRRGGS